MIRAVQTPILELDPPAADERVSYGGHPSQFAELYRPERPGPFPVVVLIHGGYWRAAHGLGHMAHLAAELRARGIAAWSLEYRRLGGDGGWPATFLDVAAGADLLRSAAARASLDLDRVVTMGFSAGGHLALWLAARSRLPVGDALRGANPLTLAGAISLAGVVDLRRGSALGLSSGVVDQLMGGAPDRVPERYAAASPYDLLPLRMPQLLIHGRSDPIVPIELSRRYVARATALDDPVDLLDLPDTGHFELIDPRRPQGRTVLERAIRLLAGSPDRAAS
jgi:acetyl esterase/lipase